VTRPLTAAERQRLRTSANLWRALIPLLIVVGVAVLLLWPRGVTPDGVHVVELSGPVAAANQQAGFTVLVPRGLASGWRPTSTELIPQSGVSKASFRIGFVTPDGKYAEVLQSNDAADAVAAQYGPLTEVGPVPVNGTDWDGFARPNGRQLIRHTVGGVTLIVTGSASQQELIQLAGSLR
jgi:uncharacterized protein DUF4245